MISKLPPFARTRDPVSCFPKAGRGRWDGIAPAFDCAFLRNGKGPALNPTNHKGDYLAITNYETSNRLLNAPTGLPTPPHVE